MLSPSGAQAAEMPWNGKLVKAAEGGNMVEVKRLLADGANVNEKNDVSEGALQRGFVYGIFWNMVGPCWSWSKVVEL